MVKSAIAAAARPRTAVPPRFTNRSALFLKVCFPGASISKAETSLSSAPSRGSRSCRKRAPGPSSSKAWATTSKRSLSISGAGGARHQSSHPPSSTGAAAVDNRPIRNSWAAPLKSGRGQAKATKGSPSSKSVIRQGGMNSTASLRRRTGSHGACIKLKVS